MFNLGLSEMVVIAVIALIFIGPKQLPDLARALGRFINEMKRSSNSLTAEFREVTDKVDEEIRKTTSEIASEKGPENVSKKDEKPS